jgi:hypothetical protein
MDGNCEKGYTFWLIGFAKKGAEIYESDALSRVVALRGRFAGTHFGREKHIPPLFYEHRLRLSIKSKQVCFVLHSPCTIFLEPLCFTNIGCGSEELKRVWLSSHLARSLLS